MARTTRHLPAFVLAAALLARATPADAIVITDVTVVIGSHTYTAATVGWTFPYTLQLGQDLVLAQSLNGPPTTTTSFNFDTSDATGPNVPEVFITVDGVTKKFVDTLGVLNVKGLDLITNEDNEAQDYGLPLDGPGYQVFLGYADNTHTGGCGVWAASIGLVGAPTCLPTPFFSATFFDGQGGFNPPQLIQTLPFHCDGTGQIPNCYEGGVIRILAVQAPEPATMALLLTGAAMLAVRRYRHHRPRRT